MKTREDFEKFRESLDQDRMFHLTENPNYNHALPRDMTLDDLRELASRKGKKLYENSFIYNGQMLIG